MMLLDADTSPVSAEGPTSIPCGETSAAVDIGAFPWMDYIEPDTERGMCSLKQNFAHIMESLTELRHQLNILQDYVEEIKDMWRKKTGIRRSKRGRDATNQENEGTRAEELPSKKKRPVK